MTLKQTLGLAAVATVTVLAYQFSQPSNSEVDLRNVCMIVDDWPVDSVTIFPKTWQQSSSVEDVQRQMRTYYELLAEGLSIDDPAAKSLLAEYMSYWDLLAEDTQAYGNDTSNYKSFKRLTDIAEQCRGVLPDAAGLVAGVSRP